MPERSQQRSTSRKKKKMVDPKIKYDIEANVKGDAEVGQLAGKLEALAKTLDGDLKTNANAAAAALRQLGDKQTAITRFVELKQGAQDAAAKLNDAQDAAQKMGQTLAATETPTRSQTGQMQKLSDAVRAAKAEVLAQNLAVQNARGALQQYGVSTQGLAQSQQNVKAAVAAAKIEVTALVPAYAQAGQAATASGNQQKQANAGVGKSVTDIGDQLRKIQNIAMIAVGGGFLGGIAKDALKTADEFNNLQARIKLVTGEGALLTSSFQGVSDVALRTNSNLEQTGTLFARIAEAGKSAGLGAKEAAAQSLSLTETINQATQLSGGSAESSKAAITQLIQALQSGVLRGEEFNSIMEQSPRLAKALADGLGVTTGELRKMSEAGALSTETVIRALRSQSDVIKTEFGSLPPTVGRAIENLNTSWTLFVGNLDKGSGISKTVAGAIDSLAGNLNTVLTVAGHAAVAWGGYTLSQKLASTGSSQMAIAVEKTALAATGQAVASSQAAVATSTHGRASVLAATQVAGYGAANTAAAAATNANTAQVAASATGYRAAGGTVLWAASKFALWGTVAYEGFGIVKSVGTALGEGIAKWQGYGNAEEVVAAQEKKLAEATRATADAQYKQAEAMRIAKDESFGLSKAAGALSVKFDTLVKGGDSAAEAIGKIGKDFDLSKLPGIRDAAGVLDRLRTDGKLTATEFQAAWAKALDGKDLAVFETTARAAFMGTKREAELLAQMLDASLHEAVKRTGLDFDDLQDKIGVVSRSALNDVDAIVGGLGRLKEQGVDTGRVLVASLSKAIDTADGVEAINALLPKIEALRKELGEKITNGLLDQAEDKVVALWDALDKATPGINSLSEALKALGVTSDVTFKKTALDAKAAYDAAKESGIASARELGEAFKKTAETAIAANKGIAPTWVTAEAAVRGYEVQVDSAGKATLRSTQDSAKSVKGLGDQWRMTSEQVKANEDAMDRLMMKYKLSADYTERQIALLETENALVERRNALEDKRLNRDKEGFSLDTGGKRVNMDVQNQRSVYENAKSQGLDEAQALQISRQFIDSLGRQIGGAQANSAKGENWGTELQKAIDKQVLRNAGSKSTSTSAEPKVSQPPLDSATVNAAEKTKATGVTTYTTNVTIDGNTRQINTTDAASSSVVQDVLRQLAVARGVSAR